MQTISQETIGGVYARPKHWPSLLGRACLCILRKAYSGRYVVSSSWGGQRLGWLWPRWAFARCHSSRGASRFIRGTSQMLMCAGVGNNGVILGSMPSADKCREEGMNRDDVEG